MLETETVSEIHVKMALFTLMAIACHLLVPESVARRMASCANMPMSRARVHQRAIAIASRLYRHAIAHLDKLA